MNRRSPFKSIYVKFVVIFIGIWWFLNSLTFGMISFFISRNYPVKFEQYRFELYNGLHRIKRLTGLTLLISAVVGTIIILIVVRGVVKPIKNLSKASREVAKGNFDISVPITGDDEIGQLTADFNLMTSELKNIEVLRKDFVSNVSHEFKTPITSIKGFARLIRDGRLSEEQLNEYSEIIVNESERLSLLSSNLLKLSELDSKLIQEQSKPYSLDEQIRKTILLLEVLWSKKEIEFDIDLEEIRINADEHLLLEVWLNLIQNAIKFSNQRGKIRITMKKTGNIVKTEISDNGVGIADSDKSRIFERFYKGDKSRSGDGNGLGLVIVKKIVELSNGRIYFDSELGKGTTFTVELPA